MKSAGQVISMGRAAVWTRRAAGVAAVAGSSAPGCVHNLVPTKVLRRTLEYAFKVTSMTGSCIPNAKSYRISSVDRQRIAVQLYYGDGLRASGLLFRT